MGYFYRKSDDESLNKLYELLENVTPLSTDCGALCGGACCKGGRGDGMLLFPGEEALFLHRKEYTVIKDERYGCNALICSGSCHRSDRPLSCRIYPYFFYVGAGGIVTVAHDVRAFGHCPLADRNISVNRELLRRLRLCAKVIAGDDMLFAFTRRISAFLTDFGGLTGIMEDLLSDC